MFRNRQAAFTLSELLIALAILGVIATFTIPKVLQSQQDAKNKSIAKEVAAAVANAFQRYRYENKLNAGTYFQDVTPYLNIVDTMASPNEVDYIHGSGDLDCGADECLKLHNGAVIHYWNGTTFGGTGTTNAMIFELDPDGKVTDGTTNGPGKSVRFFIYYNGRVTTQTNILPNTLIHSSGSPEWYDPGSYDPPWFNWN